MLVTLYIIMICSAMLCECKMEGFVVGGGPANIQDFPYIAYLGIKCVEHDGVEVYSCGSSIVNQRLTLTAAHCLFFCMESSKIIISVGNVIISKGVKSTAHSFLIHERYCQKTADNDIAFVMVVKSMNFSASVSRVALMPTPPYNEEAQIAGWGLVNEQNEETTNSLKFTNQMVMDQKDCINVLHRMPKGTFCASGKTLRGYASVGDSGSPLVVRKFIQIGIVSFKKPDVNRGLVIYTDTGYFYKWIKRNAKKIMCC